MGLKIGDRLPMEGEMEGSRDIRVGPPPPGPACPHDHLVEFYETEGALVDTVAGFLGPPLAAGHAAVVVATPARRGAFAVALRHAGHDLEELETDGRLVLLDAATLVARFMVGGTPDSGRFRATMGPVLDAAATGGRAVHVYGEMVALLWADGDATSAIRLEDHWNDLARHRAFRLLCAYPMAAFDRPDAIAAFRRICDQHTHVVPSESYARLDDDDARSRMVARLRQEVGALRSELGDLRGQRAALAELAYADGLTALANRRAFDRDLEREWALARRGDVDSYVAVADLDGFKRVNDALGHRAGDELLCRFAACLRSAVRDSDVVARTGGDEFAVLLLRCDESEAVRFAERLARLTRAVRAGVTGPLTCTLGHASLRASGSPADALARADLEMLARKRLRSRAPLVPGAPREPGAERHWTF